MAPALGTECGAVVTVYAASSTGMILTQLPGGDLGDEYHLRYVLVAGPVGVATAVRVLLPTLEGGRRVRAARAGAGDTPTC
jgi:hypothetical protein